MKENEIDGKKGLGEGWMGGLGFEKWKLMIEEEIDGEVKLGLDERERKLIDESEGGNRCWKGKERKRER